MYVWLDSAEESTETMNQTFNLSLGGQVVILIRYSEGIIKMIKIGCFYHFFVLFFNKDMVVYVVGDVIVLDGFKEGFFDIEVIFYLKIEVFGIYFDVF